MQNNFEWAQRQNDGKWVLWKYMIDPTVDHADWEGMEMLMPKIWVPVKVVDYMVEFVQ